MQSHCNGLQLDQPLSQPIGGRTAALATSCAGAYFRSACASPADRAYHIATLWLHEVSANRLTGSAGMLPNYALERSVKGLAVGAAGARKIVAPAALAIAVPRPAQRER